MRGCAGAGYTHLPSNPVARLVPPEDCYITLLLHFVRLAVLLCFSPCYILVNKGDGDLELVSKNKVQVMMSSCGQKAMTEAVCCKTGSSPRSGTGCKPTQPSAEELAEQQQPVTGRAAALPGPDLVLGRNRQRGSSPAELLL